MQVSEQNDPQEREERRLKHEAWLKTSQAAQQHKNRIELVTKYLKNPSQWPGGPDWPNWNKPHEIWYTGQEAYWAAEVAKADAQTKPEKPPETVTIIPPSVTISSSVTEIPVTENTPVTEIQTPFSVTPKPRGRPASGSAMTAAERMKAYRARQTLTPNSSTSKILL